MSNVDDYRSGIFARGFITFESASDFRTKLLSSQVYEHLSGWTQTFFGPNEVWVDPLNNYATARDNNHGVAVIGLCLNPFDNWRSNEEVAEALFAALKTSLRDFYDQVDRLSGSFVILYRLGDDVRALQDCAATKPVYYHDDKSFGPIVTSHANIIAKTSNLSIDKRAEYVFENDIYKDDPSRYLPGMITPFVGLSCLSANTELRLKALQVQRFFPREPLEMAELSDALLDQIADVMRSQAEILAATGRPLLVAATAGRDSRVSIAAFAGHQNTKLFTFHFPDTGHLSEDAETAECLANLLGTELMTFDLGSYKRPDFQPPFYITSPMGIWPAATQCYMDEFNPDAIHIRSTVSEIGRVFYGKRPTTEVSAQALARSYSITDFQNDELVIDTLQDFINTTQFSEDKFFNYNIYDMFYWEHRNSKWQNVLCQEAEMATDLFIPYNNRKLIQMFLSVPERQRREALIHVALAGRLQPAIASVPYVS